VQIKRADTTRRATEPLQDGSPLGKNLTDGDGKISDQ
jgi:hypothetical protein